MAEWMTTEEVAEFAGVPKRTVDDWCYRRVLKFYRPSHTRRRRFRRSEVTEFLERGAVEAVSS